MKFNIIEDIIYYSLDNLVDTLDNPKELLKSPNLVLFGENGILDSLALVSILIIIEERIEELTGKTVTLADEKAMSRRNSPFRTVTMLGNYIEEVISGDSIVQ